MKKILLSLFILFMPVCLWSGGVLFMAGGVESGGSTCTTDNDSQIIDETGTATGTSSTPYTAGRFVVASSTDVTQFLMDIYDDGDTGVGNIRVSIWSNSCSMCDGSDDEPNAEISGTNISVNMSDVGGSAGNIQTVTYSSAYSALSPGTYWLNSLEENGAARRTRRKNDTGDIRAFSDDGTTWNITSDQSYIFEVYGCQ